MGIIRIFDGKKKPAKKKPGWEQQEREYKEWLARTKSMTLGITKPKAKVVKVKSPLHQGTPVIPEYRLHKFPSLITPGGSCTKPVPRPEILYRDSPELLARELKARERKFTTAPAYNKGNAVLITDEMMKDITAGKTRRR